MQWCISLKSTTPEYVEDHKGDLTLEGAVNLVRKWFWYFDTPHLEFKYVLQDISNKVEETFIHVIQSQDIETTENY